MTSHNEFLYGLCGGFTGTLISHPFDTVKTRIQTGSCLTIREALKKRQLYSGLTAPMIGIMFEKSIVFGFYEKSKQYGFSNFTSGIIGGFISTLIVTPIDRIKIIYQNGTGALRGIGLRSLYKGFVPTIFRETPGFGIYFYTYNVLTERYKDKEENLFRTFIFGAISGFSAWVFIYPSDLIKTNYQAQAKGLTLVDTVKTILTPQVKPMNLYKGFSLAIMRAMPLHGGVFLGYELAKKGNMSTFPSLENY